MSHIIINGEKKSSDSFCISAYDRGLTLGHGLFETLLVNKGIAPLLDYHWDRFVTSVKFLGIQLPFKFEEFSGMIDEVIYDNKLTDVKAGVRLTVTDGVSERGLLSTGNQMPTYILTSFSLPESTTKPMSATIVETKRNEHSQASRIKSISYLDNILAKKEAFFKGFDEAFLLNSKLNLAEGALSNVFVVKDGVVYTPPLSDGALPGVVRHVILNALVLNGISILEEHISTKMLYNADEIFISNALVGIKPISKLDDYFLLSPFRITESVLLSLNTQFNYL